MPKDYLDPKSIPKFVNKLIKPPVYKAKYTTKTKVCERTKRQKEKVAYKRTKKRCIYCGYK